MSIVVHLSDLHFGKDLLEPLIARVNELTPYLADLTQRPRRGQ
jgi:hypothetical protein